MSEFIRREFLAAQQDIKSFLRPVADLTDDECVQILKRYSAAISGNFVPWMAAAAVCSRSLESRFAAAENVYLEIKDDHPNLLREFVRRSGAEPENRDHDSIAPDVRLVQSEVSKMSGLFLIALMGLLESTSAEFIPWLADISRRLGNSDFRYTDVHGIADIEHAEQFQWALEKEAGNYEKPEHEIHRAVQIGLKFIKAALRPR